MKTTENHVYIPKGWGSELWVTNNNEFCGKLLSFGSGKSFSWHFHKLKHEVFYIQQGKVRIFYSWEDDLSAAHSVDLKNGDSFDVAIGLRHKIHALEESLVFEFSTQHLESDSYRILKGD